MLFCFAVVNAFEDHKKWKSMYTLNLTWFFVVDISLVAIDIWMLKSTTRVKSHHENAIFWNVETIFPRLQHTYTLQRSSRRLLHDSIWFSICKAPWILSGTINPCFVLSIVCSVVSCSFFYWFQLTISIKTPFSAQCRKWAKIMPWPHMSLKNPDLSESNLAPNQAQVPCACSVWLQTNPWIQTLAIETWPL